MSDSTNAGIQVISRAAAILREVTASGEGRSLGQLAAATGLARSTVQRIVNALEAEHLVQAGAGGVRPGWGLRRMGELAGPGVARGLRPHLYKLYEATGETVDVSTLVGPDVLFLDRFLSGQRPGAVPGIDRKYPAYSMANGKALLAALADDEVRALVGSGLLDPLTTATVRDVDVLLDQLQAIRQGAFAYDLEEHAMGVVAIAVGIPPRDGQLLSLSVVLPSERFARERSRIEKALTEAATAVRSSEA